jgi:hypothetical protein
MADYPIYPSATTQYSCDYLVYPSATTQYVQLLRLPIMFIFYDYPICPTSATTQNIQFLRLLNMFKSCNYPTCSTSTTTKYVQLLPQSIMLFHDYAKCLFYHFSAIDCNKLIAVCGNRGQIMKEIESYSGSLKSSESCFVPSLELQQSVATVSYTSHWVGKSLNQSRNFHTRRATANRLELYFVRRL